MRRTAPASRPYGRYAVGLRPSLDPDALLRRATAAIGEDRTSDQEPLDRPRSFRDDLRFCVFVQLTQDYRRMIGRRWQSMKPPADLAFDSQNGWSSLDVC